MQYSLMLAMAPRSELSAAIAAYTCSARGEALQGGGDRGQRIPAPPLGFRDAGLTGGGNRIEIACREAQPLRW